MNRARPLETAKIIDVWFLKPRLFKSDTGRWCCTTLRTDEWRVTGNGPTPLEAYEHMKRIIVAVYKRQRHSAVEFA